MSNRTGTGTGKAPEQPGEPPFARVLRRQFEAMPTDAAIDEIVRATRDAAGSSDSDHVPTEQIRQFAAFHRLTRTSGNEAMRNTASGWAGSTAISLARVISLSLDETQMKVAAALYTILERADSLDGNGTRLLALLAGTLADLVTLRAGPISLPDGATAAEIDIDHWRKEALSRATRETE